MISEGRTLWWHERMMRWCVALDCTQNMWFAALCLLTHCTHSASQNCIQHVNNMSMISEGRTLWWHECMTPSVALNCTRNMWFAALCFILTHCTVAAGITFDMLTRCQWFHREEPCGDTNVTYEAQRDALDCTGKMWTAAENLLRHSHWTQELHFKEGACQQYIWL